MWETALTILKDNWKSLLVVLVLAGGGVWFGTFITHSELATQALAFSQEKQTLTDGFNEKQRQWDQERLSAANQYAADLSSARAAENAWHKKADTLTLQLDEKQKAHDKTVRDLNRRLSDALKNDGPGYTGIGPDGLQLFREALGYPATGGITAGQHLSETSGSAAAYPGTTGRTGGGLSAGGIITFSTEYGQWCQLLEDRLQAINEYYRE
ncbi:hypothetical protein F384_22535 [Citrobacter amalonaticus Y19]|uniref:Uncharacterized protein n=1 Tax=Citrobacter amalonaticus Y19 TaxID=1261127 RepID=A0A0F6TYM1_CITAM|nr:hypothetical protein [Citrobacter amalonaticus]AKE61142.1 hypothetical protein F384_22535 [Citrobacter amalonaticus Y19]